MEGEMDVPNLSSPKLDENSLGSSSEVGGQELIRTVVSLTGVPENLMTEELGSILELSGQDANTLTLDQLRQAILVYLESLEKEFEAEIPSS
jgi:hypothetical protein